MPDDRKNEPVQSDFDDWLADEDADPIDPTVPVDALDVDDDADLPTAEIEGDTEATEALGSEALGDETGEVIEPIIVDDDVEDDFVIDDDDEVTAPDTTNEFAPVADDPDPVETPSDEAVDLGDQSDEPVEDPDEEDLFIIDEEPIADADEVPVIAWDGADDDVAYDVAPTDDDPDFDTGEVPVGEAPVVEFDAFDGGHEHITGEMEIIAPDIDDADLSEDPVFDAEAADLFEEPDRPLEPIVDITPIIEQHGVTELETDPPFDFGHVDPTDRFDPFEDTGEAVFVTGESPILGGGPTPVSDAAVVGGSLGGSSFADLWGVEDVTATPAVSEPAEPVATPAEADGFDDDEFHLATDDFQKGQTREHAGLAEAIAAAETEETEKVALVASIPGLESSVVGFEDVVEAEGYRKVRAKGAGDLVARVTTGLVLVVALAASLVWRPALLVLAMAVFVLGAGEFYTALVRHDRKPIALFGFIGIIAACLGAFAWSAAAIPMAFVLAAVLLLLFYAVTPGKPDPMGNLALTSTVMVWAGLGSFAMLIAKSDDYRTLILGVVVTVAAADIAAFFVGRSIGRTHFAPWVSPKKTVEGLVAGVIVAFGVGAVLHFFPPFELTSGLAIGAAAAVLTPMGDLAMSAAKRTLGLKDMGSVLPGHGGFLDRIDGLLFVIPAAWAIFVWAGLL